MIARRPWMQEEDVAWKRADRPRIVRLRRDGEIIVVKQFAPNKGFIEVDGETDYRMTLEWTEE